MLNGLHNYNSFRNYNNKKCAEIYFKNDYFLIFCVFCESTMFDYMDLLEHFKNVHLPLIHNESATKHNAKEETKFNADYSMETEYLEEYIEENTKECDSNKTKEYSYINEENTLDGSLLSVKKNVLEVPLVPYEKDGIEIALKPYKCDICFKSFNMKNFYDDHIEKVHTTKINSTNSQNGEKSIDNLKIKGRNKQDNFPCSQCHKVYKSKAAVKIHELKHSGVRNFHCIYENCGKSFFNPKILTTHIRIVHRTEKNYICDICGYRTKLESALVIHKRSHTGEKPYSCKICNKSFGSQALLCEHRYTHSKERPHKCEICGAAFSLRKALYHHKYLHLDMKHYICQICGKAYAQAAGLSGHLRLHKAKKNPIPTL